MFLQISLREYLLRGGYAAAAAFPLHVDGKVLGALALARPNRMRSIRIDPGKIQFEITESAMIDEPIGIMETLFQLKELGVKLSIDDFGTVYSGLSHLQKLPVDAVKIDQSFVAPMLSSSTSAIIVRSIEACHDLGLEVVAEGVEDQATMDQLGAWKCDVAQGYLISKPFINGAVRRLEPAMDSGLACSLMVSILIKTLPGLAAEIAGINHFLE